MHVMNAMHVLHDMHAIHTMRVMRGKLSMPVMHAMHDMSRCHAQTLEASLLLALECDRDVLVVFEVFGYFH